MERRTWCLLKCKQTKLDGFDGLYWIPVNNNKKWCKLSAGDWVEKRRGLGSILVVDKASEVLWWQGERTAEVPLSKVKNPQKLTFTGVPCLRPSVAGIDSSTLPVTLKGM